jgi:hypothetical protein
MGTVGLGFRDSRPVLTPLRTDECVITSAARNGIKTRRAAQPSPLETPSIFQPQNIEKQNIGSQTAAIQIITNTKEMRFPIKETRQTHR